MFYSDKITSVVVCIKTNIVFKEVQSWLNVQFVVKVLTSEIT